MQIALDRRDEVKDGGERLQHLRLRDAHGPVGADAAQIVPFEVHDHRQLGPVLFACEKFHGKRLVLGGTLPAGSRSLDGPGLHTAAAHLQEALRRGADDGAVVEREVRGHGGGVDAAELQVEFLRRDH